MRNPLESWSKSDSEFGGCCTEYVELGKNDLELAQKLIKAGSEHRKFLRQIFVSVDITAPLYWWKEFSTYKIGTVANSTSTMHKLASTPITMECFECGEMIYQGTIAELEMNRLKYLETKDKRYWKQLIVNLPESWLQTRTITLNYENILNMYQQRCVHPHKLSEWSVLFKEWVESLPYAKELLCISLVKK
jgi:hypothetical protein